MYVVQVLRDLPSKNFFLQVAIRKKAKDFLFRRATYKGTCVQAVESAKEGKKVAPAKARFRVPYTKNFFFGSQVFGF